MFHRGLLCQLCHLYHLQLEPRIYKGVEHIHGLEHPDPCVGSQSQKIFTHKNHHKEILSRSNPPRPQQKEHMTHHTTQCSNSAPTLLSASQCSKGCRLMSPLLYIASMPEMMALITIKKPMAASKRKDSTIFFKDGCLGPKGKLTATPNTPCRIVTFILNTQEPHRTTKSTW